ncbi:unnamed protein product [Symbiodinium sp. KB8]|nr:unnamed protein product [Symbiodinium sp. KB8]
MKDVVRALERSSWQLRKTEKMANQLHEMPDVHAWQCLSFTGVLAASGYEEHPELKQVAARQNWTSMTQAAMPSVACEMALLVKAVWEKQVAQLNLG